MLEFEADNHNKGSSLVGFAEWAGILGWMLLWKFLQNENGK